MDQSNNDCRIVLSGSDEYSIEVPIAAYDNIVSTYSLKVVNTHSPSVLNSNIPSFFHTISADIDKNNYIFFDYYASNNFYIFYEHNLAEESVDHFFPSTILPANYSSINFCKKNFYIFLNFWVMHSVFSSAYEDSSFFDHNPFVCYDKPSACFYIDKNHLINIADVSAFHLIPDLNILYNIFISSDVYLFEDEPYPPQEELASENLLDSLLSSLVNNKIKKFTSQNVENENINTSTNASGLSSICSNYTFMSDTANLVSSNYQFANKIKYFPICSHPSRLGEISFCNYSAGSQVRCSIYQNSDKDIVFYTLDGNSYTLKYSLSSENHVYNVVMDDKTYVMNYSFCLLEYTYEKSLEICLKMFEDFISNFSKEYEIKDLSEDKNLNILSKDFFIHLVNS